MNESMTRLGFFIRKFFPVFLGMLILLSQPASALAEEQYYSDNSNRQDPLAGVKQRGQVEVGEFTGAAVYEYPITLPAGRNGLTPSVAITHNSQDTALHNLVGYHWSLTEYSIKRFNKQGVDEMYSREDFIASGPFGGGELVSKGGELFAEKYESSFARYEKQGDRWLVTDKSGRQYKFGYSADTRQFDPTDPNRIFQWMLEEIRDPNGNLIRYEYEKINNQIYPSKIIYDPFEVRFLRGAAQREDRQFSYASGFLVETNHLIDGIEVNAGGKLRRKYDINYHQINPLVRNTIGSITETGYSESGQATTLPATRFEYTPSTISWELTSEYEPTVNFATCHSDAGCGSHGIKSFWDMTGDGLVDLIISPHSDFIKVNNGKGNWVDTPKQGYPYPNQAPDVNTKLSDFDGDGRTDYFNSSIKNANHPWQNPIVGSYLSLARGPTISDTIPISFSGRDALFPDNGASVADLNGDGLPDIVQKRALYDANEERYYEEATCLNKDGTSCQLTNLWPSPESLAVDGLNVQKQRESYVQDCNSDGLADFYRGGVTGGITINDGKGGWTTIPNGHSCEFTRPDNMLYRSIDLNSDGHMDKVTAYWNVLHNRDVPVNEIEVNTGRQRVLDSARFPAYFGRGNLWATNHVDQEGIRIFDVNGDLLPDVVQSYRHTEDRGNNPSIITYKKNVWLHNGSRPYFLKTVHTSTGGQIDLEYKTSAQYMKPDGTQANPNLPIIVTTVSKMSVHDGLGTVSRTDYFYEDGHYYYDHAQDKAFAGFRVVTKTDGQGYKTKNYYHQSQHSVQDSAGGEFQDHISKKGRVYRQEVYSNWGAIAIQVINRYSHQILGQDHYYPFLVQTVTKSIDGGVTKATAKAFQYDQYGNKSQVTDYGEVSAGNDGSFTDIGNDLIRTTSNYTADTGSYMVAYPTESQVFDQAGQKRSHAKTYYDGLSHGQVLKGNATANEVWLDTNNTWVRTETQYNQYGLPTVATNARGFSTTTTYDSHNLYPSTTTNAKGQRIEHIYDPYLGQMIRGTDLNGSVTNTSYDGLGRPTQVERDGQLISTTNYNDGAMPRSAHTRAFNDDGQSVDQFTYLDGLDRAIEVKKEAPNNKWIVTQSIYDDRGQLVKEVQPYFSGSSSFESLSASKVGNAMTYDAKGRVTSITNPLGTTTNSYRDWEVTTVDPEGHQKTIAKDARGNLIRVDEKNGGTTYQTHYTYDALGRLMQIRDAQNNLRSFDYDSLGRRKFQTILGGTDKWRYQYDANGNLTQKSDPKNQVTTYAYDELDRVLTEDFQGQAGNELVYEYDQGANAIGKLNKVWTPGYEHHLSYDSWGRMIADRKIIDAKAFDTSFTYDRMGAVRQMTYPDGTQAHYEYDGAHQLRELRVGNKVYADNFEYAPTGQVTSMTLGNGITVQNNYDPAKMYRLTAKTSTNDHQNFAYTYDKIGNLTRLIDSNTGQTAKTVDYSYDDLSRLTQAAYTGTANQNDITQTYAYDAIGNMTFKSDVGVMTYGAHPHAVTNAGAHIYAYDDNGNMASKDGTAMTYDHRDRLLQSDGEASFKYGEGYDRISKTDLLTGETTYYPDKYFEVRPDKEVKYIYAGSERIAKIERETQVTPPNPPTPPTPPVPSAPPGGPNPPPAPPTPPNPTPPPPTNTPAPAEETSQRKSGGGGGYGSQERLALMQIVREGRNQKMDNFKNYHSDYRLKSKYMAEAKEQKEGALPEHAFDNLKIKYNKNATLVTWDAMPKEVTHFKIYRSKGSYAHALDEPEIFVRTVPASRFKNRYLDRHEDQPFAKYSYKVEALSKKRKVLVTSINLHANQIFVYEGQQKIVDFRNFSKADFSHVKIYSNEYVDGKETSIPQRLMIRPDEALDAGARIKVRFLNCHLKRDGSKFCKNLDQQYVEVYVLERSKALQKGFAFLGKQAKRLATALVPQAYANPDETTYYFLTDHLGSIDVVLDDQGNVVERRDFLPYGAERLTTIGDSETDHKFTGKELDDETGLHYYGARYYDSAIGRFTSIDPLVMDEAKMTEETLLTILANPQKLNAYAYVLNNPVKFTDPFGESEFTDKWKARGDFIDGALLSVIGIGKTNKIIRAAGSVRKGLGYAYIGGLGTAQATTSSLYLKDGIKIDGDVSQIEGNANYMNKAMLFATKAKSFVGKSLNAASKLPGWGEAFEATAEMYENDVTARDFFFSMKYVGPEVKDHASQFLDKVETGLSQSLDKVRQPDHKTKEKERKAD